VRRGERLPIQISAGVVERRSGELLESMLKRADEAMYRAKDAGRNRVASG
jgi:diguanylate cyclase